RDDGVGEGEGVAQRHRARPHPLPEQRHLVEAVGVEPRRAADALEEHGAAEKTQRRGERAVAPRLGHGWRAFSAADASRAAAVTIGSVSRRAASSRAALTRRSSLPAFLVSISASARAAAARTGTYASWVRFWISGSTAAGSPSAPSAATISRR